MLLLCRADAFGQSIIVLKTARPVAPLAGDRITLTLRSGATITVAAADIDYDMTSKIVAMSPPNPTPSTLDATVEINAFCANMFATNFTMQASCRQQNQDAVRALTKRDMSTGDRATIRRECVRLFPGGNYTMRNSCEEQQLESLKQLGR